VGCPSRVEQLTSQRLGSEKSKYKREWKDEAGGTSPSPVEQTSTSDQLIHLHTHNAASSVACFMFSCKLRVFREFSFTCISEREGAAQSHTHTHTHSHGHTRVRKSGSGEALP